MWALRNLYVAGLCWLILAPSVQAATITLRITPRSTYNHGEARLDVRLDNVGNAPAEAIHLTARLGDHRLEGPRRERLEPGASHSGSILLGAPPLPKGIHTIRLTVSYEDVGGHPFQALSTIPLYTADAAPDTAVTVSMAGESLKTSGTLTLTLASNDSRDRLLSCSLFLPEEIGCETPVQTITLPGGASRDLHFPITNKTGLRGSYYRVYAIVESSDADLFMSRAATSWVAIHAYHILSDRECKALMAVAVLLLLVFLLAQRGAPDAQRAH